MSNTIKLKQVKKLSKELELKTIEELRHHVWLLTQRLAHTEVELVQARVSRDSWREKCAALKREKAPGEPRLDALPRED